MAVFGKGFMNLVLPGSMVKRAASHVLWVSADFLRVYSHLVCIYGSRNMLRSIEVCWNQGFLPFLPRVMAPTLQEPQNTTDSKPLRARNILSPNTRMPVLFSNLYVPIS